ncbi:MAG: excisionase family DNA-binding protein [Candidatus Omnitrophica bacterium]|nr:excisionase family DNA-binding protein [Candidatus Omnitrophota bacterium]
MISINSDGKLCVGWVQNGIKHKRYFRSEKEAERFQEMIDDIQNCMKLSEEMERFARDFNYDPKIVELKFAQLGKEIEELKERIRVKESLQKKLGVATQRLADQPRNVIDKDTFFKELKQLKVEINRLDRFFKEHTILSLHKSLQETLSEMKEYFTYQKATIKNVEEMFKQLRKEVVQKFSSITTKDKVLTIKETAKYLGISYSTVQSMMFMQDLPYTRVGNRYRIKENDLQSWMEKRKQKTARTL